MRFFSRYSYLWKFPTEQERTYDEFVLPANLISLRLVAFITIFGMSLFLLFDFFRDVDFSIVLGARSVSLVCALTIMLLSFRQHITIYFIRTGIIVLTLVTISVALVTATFAGIPPYYLTNLIFVVFILVTAASGLNLRHALLLNTLCLAIFICYSQVVKRDPFYFSQYPHLFSIFFYINIVGVVLESRRRMNFLQFNDLKKQKSLVEELNQQKNKIISILSHDVASPLNSLAGLLQLQTGGHVKEEELKPFLNDVGNQLNNVSALLQSLVRWSRSQMEGFVPEKKTVHLNKHLEEHVNLFRPAAIDKVINLKLVSEKQLSVLADEEMVRIAIRNLISNAIKFANSGTDVMVEAFTNPKNKIIIRFTNEGSPVPKDLREKLFSFNVHSSEGTSGEKGTGLGLAMTAFFVRLNGGEIYLETKERERHTCFIIELPATETQTVPAQIGLVTSNFSR